MAPTVYIKGSNRFFFNSREERRRHIHVATPEGTAKFWLEPIVSLADFYNLSQKDLKELQLIVEEMQDEFIEKWNKHFNQ
ncbi:MAG: DUF4160 domain-containing protein [Bacteroidetes bacterium]|nr:DUF4160 domain-containing protein [Bacteroidota bacterium]